MGKRKINYTGIIISVIQLLLLALPFIFEYLSKVKPLVMRHLYTKKLEHLSTILDASNRNIYAAIIIIMAAVFLFLLIKKANIRINDFIFNWILTSILVFMLSFDLFSNKITFTYSIGILFLVWILDIVRLFVKNTFTNKYKIFS